MKIQTKQILLGDSGLVVLGAAATWVARARRRQRCQGTRLIASVGNGGNNSPRDVLALRGLLCELGYSWVGTENDVVDRDLVQTIKLVESIVAGRHVVSGDGVIRVPGRLHDWLWTSFAPRWVQMPRSGRGFDNYERRDLRDDHDWGTSWMADAIEGAGRTYKRDHLDAGHSAALMTINDVSRPRGGATPDHAGHECGLACDLRLPRLDGAAGQITWRDDQFDRNASRAQLKALRAESLFHRALFNDPALVTEGLCRPARGHDDHIHFEIRASRIAVG